MTLTGRRIVVTRARPAAAVLRRLIESEGGQAVLCPMIRIAAADDPRPLEDAAARVESYDAVIIGSVHAAEALAGVLRRLGRQASVPIACVGTKTAGRIARDPDMQAILQGPRWVPATFRAEALVERVSSELNDLSGRRFLFPRAPEGRAEVADRLEAAGASVDAPVAYRIMAEPPAPPEIRAAVQHADAWIFMSGNTLEASFSVLGETTTRRLLARSVVAAIGPVAADRAAQRGIRVDVVPARATAEDLVAALSAYFRSPNRRETERR